MTKSWPYSSSWIYINQADRVLTRQHSCPSWQGNFKNATADDKMETTAFRYTFTTEALENLAEKHDNLQNQKSETLDENRRGHITKAIMQLI